MEMMRLICHNFTHNHCEIIFTLIKYHKSIQSDLLTRLINNMTLCNLTLHLTEAHIPQDGHQRTI